MHLQNEPHSSMRAYLPVGVLHTVTRLHFLTLSLMWQWHHRLKGGTSGCVYRWKLQVGISRTWFHLFNAWNPLQDVKRRKRKKQAAELSGICDLEEKGTMCSGCKHFNSSGQTRTSGIHSPGQGHLNVFYGAAEVCVASFVVSFRGEWKCS